MVKNILHLLAWLAVAMLLAAGIGQPGWAQSGSMGGWEKGSAYDQLFRPAEADRIKAIIEAITEITPLPGMSPGVGLKVRDADGQQVLVHIGPGWFVKPDELGVREGDEVKIKGAWAEIAGEDVFIASKIKKGEFVEYKVRLTRDGTPFWTLSPEELARERAGE